MNVVYSLIIAFLLAAGGYAADAYLPSPIGIVLAVILWIGAAVIVIRMVLGLAGGGPGPGAHTGGRPAI